MSVAALSVVLAVALGGLAVVLNHVYARVALVELALNEGLPPGHQATVVTTSSSAVEPAQILPSGVHIFLSRTCHACQRLVDELDAVDLTIGADVHVRYSDRPRPIATSVASRHGAVLHEYQADLSRQVGADPLPFTIAIGDHDLVARRVSPTVAAVLDTARDAGIAATRTQS